MKHKNMILGLLYFSFIVAFISLFLTLGLCFNTNKGGHRELADKSIQLKKNMNTDLKNNLNPRYEEAIKQGAVNEDAIISNEIIPRWMHHFYNPFTGKGLPYFENAQQRAMKMFNSALDDYCGGNKEKAWDKLGHVLHLLQDMGSPSHVHNASHVFQNFPLCSSWGFENYGRVESRGRCSLDMSDRKYAIMFREEAKRNE